MDPHSLSLLEKPHPLRRADLFGRLAQTQLVAYELAAIDHEPGVEIGRRSKNFQRITLGRTNSDVFQAACPVLNSPNVVTL